LRTAVSRLLLPLVRHSRNTLSSAPKTRKLPASDVDELLGKLAEAVRKSDLEIAEPSTVVAPEELSLEDQALGGTIDFASAVILLLIAIAVGIAIGLLSDHLLG
jgi:hypothetical protein